MLLHCKICGKWLMGLDAGVGGFQPVFMVHSTSTGRKADSVQASCTRAPHSAHCALYSMICQLLSYTDAMPFPAQRGVRVCMPLKRATYKYAGREGGLVARASATIPLTTPSMSWLAMYASSSWMTALPASFFAILVSDVSESCTE